MNSNTYMTTRVPANWDDPEFEEMSQVYLSTGSMAWEGEPETDYTIEVSPWDLLSLPFHPDTISDSALSDSSSTQNSRRVRFEEIVAGESEEDAAHMMDRTLYLAQTLKDQKEAESANGLFTDINFRYILSFFYPLSLLSY